MDQYFTKNIALLNDLKYLVSLDTSFHNVLEPSCGEGDIIKYCIPNDKNVTGVEIDDTLNTPEGTIIDDFLTHSFGNKKFDLIIGNPPFSLTTEFLIKCTDLLSSNGVMIMVIPERTFKLTSNIPLVTKMDSLGIFTHYIKYNDEHLFKDANVSVIIFRFIVSTELSLELRPSVLPHEIKYKIDNRDYINMKYTIDPILNIYKTGTGHRTKIGDVFNIYVGYVCGAESIMKIDKNKIDTAVHKIQILKAQNKREWFYDFTKEEDATPIRQYKQELLQRKIAKFSESNWFVYGLKRNERVIEENLNKPCLYVYNQKRGDDTICFKGVVETFGGNLICCIPKEDEDADALDEIADYINSKEFREQYTVSGNKFMIGYRQLLNAFI